MSASRAPAELRFLIRKVRDGVANPDSLASINTTELPDGAVCSVSDDGTLWRLDKSSSFMPTSEAIAPVAGPGRWFYFGVEAFASPGVMVVGSGANTFAVGGNWGQPTSSEFALQQLTGDLNAWSLTALGGILTYAGPSRLFNVAIYASMNVGDATAARQVFVGVSHNNDLTGAAASDGNNISATLSTASIQYVLATSRLVRLSSGNTLRMKAAAASAASSLGAAAVRMIVSPA